MSHQQQVLLLLVYVVLDAALQGHHTLLFRRWVAPKEQRSINLNLHGVAPLLYVLFTIAVCRDWVPGYGYAAVLRIALFDPVLNFSKGDALFAVGGSSNWDRVTMWIALKLHTTANMLSLIGRAVFTVLAVAALLLLGGCASSKLVANASPAQENSAPADSAKRRLFGLFPPAKPKPPITVSVPGMVPRIGKKSTVIIQTGTGNTAAVTGKKAGPTAVGDSASAADNTKSGQKGGTSATGQSTATNNAKAGQRGGAAATGHGSSVQVTKPPASSWWKWALGGTFLGFCIRQFGPKLFRIAVPVSCLLLVASCTTQHLPGARELQTAHSPHPVKRHKFTGPMKRALR